uniref:Helicase ATP-binding domain-containing protein n=2 Tax=Corethron hystrix TaxID=216773 RepID=A0A6U5J3T4_9STRA
MTVRHNLCRADVLAGRMEHRKQARIESRRKRKSVSGERKTKLNTSLVGGMEDYCVENYLSEDEVLRSTDDDSDGDDEEGRKDRGILDGHSLDGSYRPPKFATTGLPSRSGEEVDETTATATATGPGTGVRKIYYASRTHSQLTQFVGECRKICPDIRIVHLASRKQLCLNDAVRYNSVPGQKKQRHLAGEAIVTERCLDLMKKHKPSSGEKGEIKKRKSSTDASGNTGCPYLPPQSLSSSSMPPPPSLALHSLAYPSDIDALRSLSESSSCCGYYASRTALPAAEIVVLPYTTLLSRSSRSGLGLSLQGNVVVLDEGHNVPEAVRSCSEAHLTANIIDQACTEVAMYAERYIERLAGRNVVYINTIRRVLNAMAKFLRIEEGGAIDEGSKKSASQIFTVTDWLFECRLESINWFQVQKYFERSGLCRKILGFTNSLARSQNRQSKSSGSNLNDQEETFISCHTSALSKVREFLVCLTNTETEGKILVEWPSCSETDESCRKNSIGSSLRYVTLDPAIRFTQLLEESHAVIVAGGTLRPFVHIAMELLGHDNKEALWLAHSADSSDGCAGNDRSAMMKPTTGVLTKDQEANTMDTGAIVVTSTAGRLHFHPSLTTFSCGHVVPPSNVHIVTVSHGPTKSTLDFRHFSRAKNDTVDELGRTVLNICNVTPAGTVIFFPSYGYEATVVGRWKETGLWECLGRRKRVHREPPNAREVEGVLKAYSSDVAAVAPQTKKERGYLGALLLCVIGGKMSEGINFADDMARCVIVVGLPYPDMGDPQLKEKMKILDAVSKSERSGSKGPGIGGRAYYHNVCMRAVNQSIGRAIRHSKDYAAIVLIDVRYKSDRRVWLGMCMHKFILTNCKEV